MPCKKCIEEPVFEFAKSKESLCASCFIKYFEKKVLKTIREYELVSPNDKIGVAVSGGKDSMSALYILRKLQARIRNFDIVGIAVDEGIHGYRDLAELETYCKEEEIPLHVYKFKDEFSFSLDEAMQRTNQKPCSVCGVLRRTILNKEARNLGVTKLATGHNLDDESQSIMMNYLKGNTEKSIRLGPKTSLVKDPRFIPRIKPLYFMSEKEVATYAFLKKFPVKFGECPNTPQSFRNAVRDSMNELELKYPGTKHAVVNSFLEMLPALIKTHEGKSANTCILCDEPSSQDICNTCKLVEGLKEK